MIFFEPTPKFIKWITSQHWLKFRKLVDCGAGVGHLGAVLVKHKLDVFGIDIQEREHYESTVHMFDATTFLNTYPPYSYDSNDVVVFARPCHGVFIENALKRAFAYGVRDVLYIGLERNLGEIEAYNYDILLNSAGKDNESVYRIYGPKSETKLYSKVNNEWGIIKYNSKFVRDSGSYMPIDLAKVEVTETKYLMNADQIYFDPEQFAAHSRKYEANSNGLDQSGWYGWVGPNGEWYPCGSRDHDTLLYNCFGLNRSRAEALNFIKCYGTFWASMDNEKKLNAKQAITLKKVGYKLKDYEIERTVETLSVEEQSKLKVRKPALRDTDNYYKGTK